MYNGTTVYNYISATELVVSSQTSITSCTTTAILPGLGTDRVYMIATHVKDTEGKDAILFTGGYTSTTKNVNTYTSAVDLLTYNIVDGKVVYAIQSYNSNAAVANIYTYLTKNLAFTTIVGESSQNRIVSPQYYKANKIDAVINNFPNAILRIREAVAKALASYTAPDTDFSIVPYLTYNNSTRNLYWYYYVKGSTKLYCMSYNSTNDTIAITM